MIRYYATEDTLHVLAGGRRYTISSATNPSLYDSVLADLKAGTLHEDDLERRLDPVKDLQGQLTSTTITLHDGHVEMTATDGQTYTLAGMIVRRIREGGVKGQHLMRFLQRCAANPRPAAILELYDFLEETGLPIGPDGHFYAYKKVRRDLTDIFSGTFDNSPGKTVSMERSLVDDNRDRTCSTGLHFAGYNYLGHYGSGPGNAIVMVKIDPADVVAIPSDYKNQKGRTARYEVIAVIGYDDVEDDRRIEGAWIEDDDDDRDEIEFDVDQEDDGYYW